MKAIRKLTAFILTLTLVAGAFSFNAFAADVTANKNYGKDGTVETIDGTFTITAAGVIVKNLIIKGDLIIEPTEGSGVIYLLNVKVEGAITIKGDATSVYLSGTASEVVLDSPGGSIRLLDGANADELTVTKEATEARVYVEKGAVIGFALVETKAKLIGRGEITEANLRVVLIEASAGLIKGFYKKPGDLKASSKAAKLTSVTTVGVTMPASTALKFVPPPVLPPVTVEAPSTLTPPAFPQTIPPQGIGGPGGGTPPVTTLPRVIFIRDIPTTVVAGGTIDFWVEVRLGTALIDDPDVTWTTSVGDVIGTWDWTGPSGTALGVGAGIEVAAGTPIGTVGTVTATYNKGKADEASASRTFTVTDGSVTVDPDDLPFTVVNVLEETPPGGVSVVIELDAGAAVPGTEDDYYLKYDLEGTDGTVQEWFIGPNGNFFVIINGLIKPNNDESKIFFEEHIHIKDKTAPPKSVTAKLEVLDVPGISQQKQLYLTVISPAITTQAEADAYTFTFTTPDNTKEDFAVRGNAADGFEFAYRAATITGAGDYTGYVSLAVNGTPTGITWQP